MTHSETPASRRLVEGSTTLTGMRKLQGVSRLVSKVIPTFFRTCVDESGCPYMCLNEQCLRFDFLENNLKFLYLVMVRPRHRPSLFFRLSLI